MEATREELKAAIADLQGRLEKLENTPPKTRYIIEVLADEQSYPAFAQNVHQVLEAAGMGFDGGYTAKWSEQPAAWVDNPLLDEDGYDRLRGEHAMLSVGRGIDRNAAATAKTDVRFRIGEYVSDVITNPTWADVVRVVDESIEVTGDEHHVWIEGVYQTTSKESGMGIAVYNVSLGS